MTDKKPTVFDAAGAFNDQHNQDKKPESFALPLDVARGLPKIALKDFITKPLAAQKAVQQAGGDFLSKVGSGLGKTFNFISQVASYGYLNTGVYGLKNVDISKELQWKNFKSWDYWKKDFEKVKDDFAKAGDVSPGRAIQTVTVGSWLNSAANTIGLPDGANNKFFEDHIKFATNDFDIYSISQREKAFREQNFGKIASWSSDFMFQWFADPTIVVGKGIKAYKALGRTLSEGMDLNKVLSGEQAGFKARKVKGTFEDFLSKTDGMNEQDLLRIKAIRESDNPAILADILADVNKISDPIARREVKILTMASAMGDADAFVKLSAKEKRIATKIGSLHDEVAEAKYLGKSIDPDTGRLTHELLNEGDSLSKAQAQLAQYEDKIDEVHKQLTLNATLDPAKVPFIDLGSKTRQAYVNSEETLLLRGGAAGAAVRVMTGFFTKRPRFWIDFTDNSSTLTIDNMLNQVVGISNSRRAEYTTKIASLTEQIASKSLKGADLTEAKKSLEELNNEFNTANFTVERRNELLSKYTGALNENERAIAYQEIEAELFDTIALQFGYTKEQVQAAYSTYAGARTRARNLIKERAYTGATEIVKSGKRSTEVPVGSRITPIVGTGGMLHVFPMPLNETQLIKQLPTLDIEAMYTALRRHTRANRIDSKYGKVFGKAYEGIAQGRIMTNDILDALDGLLKFEVLARLGYPIRNATEGNMRIMATVGPLALWEANSQYGKNFMLNSARFRFTAKEALTIAERTRLDTERMALYAGRDLADDPIAVDAAIMELDALLDGKGSKFTKEKFGVGTYEHNGVTLNDAKGATVEQSKYYDEKFIREGSSLMDTSLTQSKRGYSRAMETNGDFVTISGSDINWAPAYIRVVNRQIRGSALSRQLLNPKVKAKDIEKWLLTDAEGQRIMRSVAQGRTALELAEANIKNVDNLFANSPQLRKIAAERSITADDITTHLGKDSRFYPDVNGAQISETNGTSPFVRAYSYTLDKFYKYLGEAPESHLTRNPLFVDLYRRRLNASVDRAIATYKGDTIPAAYLRKLEYNARQFARQEMRRTLYDISERSTNAATMRYIFPFFGAFSDVAEKWTRIVANDPSVAAKMNIAWEAPDRAGLTEERDGLTYINIPGSWTKNIPGLDGRELSIPKASLNLIFQGGSWWNPGAGWFVQIAASNLVKRYTDLEKNAFIKEILPYGPKKSSSLPGIAGFAEELLVQNAALRKTIDAFNEESPGRQRLTAIIFAEEWVNFNRGLRNDKPTKDEINSKVMKVLALEIGSRAILPFATNYKSPYQFYIDEYQKLRQADPLTAGEQFYDKFGPNYFEMSTSISQNNTGVASTQSAYKRSKELKDLIALQPEYGWFLVGDTNSGEFSPTVYGNQFEQKVGAGSTTAFRERQDPYKAVEDAQAEKGWLTYRKGMAFLEAARIKAGLPSLNVKAAEFLQVRKRQFIAELGNENPAWIDAYKKIDSGKVIKFLKFATTIVDDPRLSGRRDIQTLKEYLNGRKWIQEQLRFRPSKSLDNPSNGDLNYKWYTFTGALIEQDITFERIYTRMLEQDNPSEGF
jgi:hypothetical protein